MGSTDGIERNHRTDVEERYGIGMNIGQKILLIVGAAFAAIGGVLTVTFAGIGMTFREMRAFLAIPVFFLVLGLCFIAAVLIGVYKKSVIVKKGTRYPAKIYSYTENTAYIVNGRFTVNVIVHYFDKNQIEREVVIPTAFEKGSSSYPIGMTMDIYEYRGKYGWDPKSVRNEILPGEQELMDDKPVNPSKLRMTAVQCPNCGASYQAAAGYTGRCPYCGSYHNVE